MDTLSPKELDYQYTKIVSYLKQNDEKIKKYKKYKSSLYRHICQSIKNDPSFEHKLPSITVIKKPAEKASLNEQLLEEFFTEIYSSRDVQKEMIRRLMEFRQKKASTIEDTIILKTNQ